MLSSGQLEPLDVRQIRVGSAEPLGHLVLLLATLLLLKGARGEPQAVASGSANQETPFCSLQGCKKLAAAKGLPFVTKHRSSGTPMGCVEFTDGTVMFVRHCWKHPNCGTTLCVGCTVLDCEEVQQFSRQEGRGISLPKATAKVGGAAAEQHAPARRLPVALPLVLHVDFQDFDLDAREVSGLVSWAPPADTTDVSGYIVYLADSLGSVASRIQVGAVPLGTNMLSVSESMSLGGLSHLYVHTRSLLGESPDGVRFEICDVTEADTLRITNVAATTAPWGVVEVSFFASPRCSGAPMRWARLNVSSGIALAEYAVDGNIATAWVSDCTVCGLGQESLEVVGVCKPEEVRCVKIWQCNPERDGKFGCPPGVGRTTDVQLYAQGEAVHAWQSMTSWPTLREEILTVPGRRRRASYTLFSEPPPKRLEQTTYCLGNAPTFECAGNPR